MARLSGLDASTNVNVTGKISLLLDAVNITDATRRENANSVFRRTLLETYGRRCYAGVRARL